MTSRNLLFAGLASAEDDLLFGQGGEVLNGNGDALVTQRGGGAVLLPPVAAVDGWSQLGGEKGLQQQQEQQRGLLAPPLGSHQSVHGSARLEQAKGLQ